MSAERQQKAMAGAEGGPLTREQKKRVCMLAREAWENAGRPNYADQPDDLPAEIRLNVSEALEIWRQDQQRKATGCQHLTCAENRLYPLLMAHFSRLSGRTWEAQRWEDRTVGDPQRQAWAKLDHEVRNARDVIEDPLRYVSAIARAKYKTSDVRGLSAKQIWTLVFDLRRGAQARRRNAHKGA